MSPMTNADYETQIRHLEAKVRYLQQTLWDRYFEVALAATLHHGKTTGVAAAAEIADEALKIREGRKS